MADIGANTVVGAGTVVVHPAPSMWLVVGNPGIPKRRLFLDAH
jgi:serine acetyltransferase